MEFICVILASLPPIKHSVSVTIFFCTVAENTQGKSMNICIYVCGQLTVSRECFIHDANDTFRLSDPPSALSLYAVNIERR